MAMSYVWVILLFVSVVFGALTGSAGAVGAAAVQGAESAVELTLSLAGPMIFYSALLEVMERSGLTEKLSRSARCWDGCFPRPGAIRSWPGSSPAT